MFFGLVTLAVALCISAVAAYYSIVGLMAIFSASAVSIAIMGVVLEIGKSIKILLDKCSYSSYVYN